MSEETIQIELNVILIGLAVGLVASLWNILPFFAPGLGNIFFTSTAAAIILLLVLSRLKKDVLIKSGVIGSLVFLLTSIVIVPFVSGIIINNNIDISQSEGLETINLKLPGLFCQGCAFSAQNALKGIPGVVDAKVTFNSKSGIVVYDPNLVTPETIVSNDLIQAYSGRLG